MKSFVQMRRYFSKRKLWIILAMILFIVETTYLIGPFGRAGEDHVNFLSGEDSWGMEDEESSPQFFQEFRPSYRKLKSISLLFFNSAQIPSDGFVSVAICDKDGNVLASQDLPYRKINYGSYTDINHLELSLNPKRSYYITVNCQAESSDPYVTVGVCPAELVLPENQHLYYADDLAHLDSSESEIVSTQLVTRYSYSNAVTSDKRFQIIFLCFITAVGIAFGLPGSKKIRFLVGWILMLLAPVFLGKQLEAISLNAENPYLLPNAMKWCCIIMFFSEICVFLCTFSFRVSIILPCVSYSMIYCADYFVRSYRGTPLKWNDVTAFRTAARIVGGYHLQPNGNMATAWCILLLFIIYALYCGGSILKDSSGNAIFSEKIFWGIHFVSTFLGFTLFIAFNGFLVKTDFLDKLGFLTQHTTDDFLMYQSNGFLISTYLDIRSSKILPPAGYSKEKAQHILQKYEMADDEVSGDPPHIILILNESFSDLRVLGNLQISEENMSFFYSLTENVIRGTTYSSVLGGGTANAEFEVLTGCTMGFLPRGYFPYMQLINHPIPTLVSSMKQSGYTTYSMHPELSTNWNRYKIYPYLGFDHSLWVEQFQNANVIHSGVSDLETYAEIEEIFEDKHETEKLFIFDLTMQNHGGYNNNDSGYNIQAVNVNSSEADIFLSLMKESDEAFKELVTYFSNQDEKVLICMYGDHQPKFYDDSFYDSVYQQTDGLTQTDILLNQYKTPFIIWANYDIPEEKDLNISMNYLGVLLQKTAGLQHSAYFGFLEELMGEYPVITANGYLDKNGNYCERDDTSFSEYRILQYYLLHDAQ